MSNPVVPNCQVEKMAARQILASINPDLARFFFVDVAYVSDDDTASTNGMHIYLPEFLLDAPVRGDETLTVGLLSHELGHFLQDLKSVSAMEQGNGIPRWFSNIFLDVILEDYVERVFPLVGNSLANFRKIISDAKSSDMLEELLEGEKVNEVVQMCMLYCRFVPVNGRRSLRSNGTSFSFSVAKTNIENALGSLSFIDDPTKDRILAMLADIEKKRSYNIEASGDAVLNMFRKYKDLIVDDEEAGSPGTRVSGPAQPGDGDGVSKGKSKKGDDDEGEEEGEASGGSGEPEPGEEGDGSSGGGDGTNDSDEGDCKGKGDGGGDGDSESESNKPSDLSSSFGLKDGSYATSSVGMDEIAKIMRGAIKQKEGVDTSMSHVVMSEPANIPNQNDEIILAKTMDHHFRKENSSSTIQAPGRVVRRALASGDPIPFAMDIMGHDAPGVDLVLLVDASPSMSDPVNLAGTIGISTSIKTRYDAASLVARSISRSVVNASGTVHVYAFGSVGFVSNKNADHHICDHGLNYIGNYVGGGTSFTFIEQIWQMHKKSVIIMVTDGVGQYPENYTDKDKDRTSLILIGDGDAMNVPWARRSFVVETLANLSSIVTGCTPGSYRR